MRRVTVACVVFCALVAASLPARGETAASLPARGDTASAGPPSATSAHFVGAVSRPISTRVFHTRLATVRNSNARRIGRSLSTLQPTWVSGLLRYRRNQYPNRKETRAWREIRRIVRAHNHAAQFDVVLNAMQYRTPAAITKAMRRIRHKLGNEGWFFDFFSTAFRRHPRMVRAAIASAHRHNEWIGGNVFGLGRRRQRLPARADFLAVQDSVLHLNLSAVRRLSKRSPIVYHLHNDPDKQRGGGCRFIERLSSQQRRRLIKRRAAQGARRGFRVAYPVLFPECLRARPNGPGNFLYSYNAFRDPPVARAIARLLDRYDFNPAS